VNVEAQTDIFVIRSTADLPFPPGQSPFRCKGNVYNHVKEFHAVRVPGGIEAVAAALEPELRSFYLTRFLTGSWYDFLPITLLERAAVTLAGDAPQSYLRAAGTDLAERDVKGVHKLLLRFASPEIALARMASVYRQYYSFGSMRIEAHHDVVKSYVEGMPAIVAPIQRVVAAAFARRLVVMAGSRSADTSFGDLQPDGERHGVKLVKHVVSTRWAR